MPTELKYNGSRLIPAPLITIEQVKNVGADGTILGNVFTITANGKLVAFKGSPNSSGSFYTGTDYPPDETITDSSRLGIIVTGKQIGRAHV